MKENPNNCGRAVALIRITLAVALISTGAILLASSFGQTRDSGGKQPQQKQNPQAKPGSQKPDVVKMVGPVSQDQDLRDLPYVPSNMIEEDKRFYRHPFPLKTRKGNQSADPIQQMVTTIISPSMPSPLLSFDTIDSNLSGCGCTPPDTEGDVGPNNWVASENSSIAIYDKVGNLLAGPINYNAFFSALGTSTPCGNQLNDGDGIVMYDHISDRWMVSDFAFPATNGPTYQCVGVSKTGDPVAGGWYLYAVAIDPTNTTSTVIGDYPKFGVWHDG